jgi:FkbM family methyltransferase
MRYIRILRNEPRPFRFLLSRVLWRTGLCRLFTIDRPGFRLRFAPSGLSARYWTYPDARQDDHDFLRAYLRPGDRTLDVGANIGALALHAAALVGEAGHVTAIEAHPRTFGFLAANVTLNRSRNVTVINTAVGDRAGTVRFTDVHSDEKNGVTDEGGLELPVRTLDELLKDTPGPFRLLKLDVEGFELNVLRGATETLARTECVCFEVSRRSSLYGYTSEDVVATLEAAGLAVLDMEGNPVPRPFEASPRAENYVAVRDAAAYRAQMAGPPARAAA